jgi:type II secretion system protein I
MRRGLTLVEVLVATAFLGICAASILDSVTLSVAQLSRVNRRSLALLLTEDTLEGYKAESRTGPPGSGTFSDTYLLSDGIIATVTTTIANGTTSENRKITVVTTWEEQVLRRNYTDSLMLEMYVRTPDD